MTFKNPEILLLLPAVFGVLYFTQKRFGKKRAWIRYSTLDFFEGLKSTARLRFSQRLFMLRIPAAVFFMLALARPQSPLEGTKISSEGIDLVLAIDSSTSMLAEDFKLRGKRRSRIDVVKNVVEQFIKERGDDRLSLVSFAAAAYTLAPLTLDHEWLLGNLKNVGAGMFEDGTAIGSGIMVSLSRLENSKAKSKMIILLTDGRNNAGSIPPITAAEAAGALGVKIYTIGAGGKGPAPFPFRDIFGNTVYRPIRVDLDEEVLAKIAQKTGGRYFRATDSESLKKIYADINKLEKTLFEERGFREHKERFPVFLVPGIFLLGLEIVLKNSRLMSLP